MICVRSCVMCSVVMNDKGLHRGDPERAAEGLRRPPAVRMCVHLSLCCPCVFVLLCVCDPLAVSLALAGCGPLSAAAALSPTITPQPPTPHRHRTKPERVSQHRAHRSTRLSHAHPSCWTRAAQIGHSGTTRLGKRPTTQRRNATAGPGPGTEKHTAHRCTRDLDRCSLLCVVSPCVALLAALWQMLSHRPALLQSHPASHPSSSMHGGNEENVYPVSRAQSSGALLSKAGQAVVGGGGDKAQRECDKENAPITRTRTRGTTSSLLPATNASGAVASVGAPAGASAMTQLNQKPRRVLQEIRPSVHNSLLQGH